MADIFQQGLLIGKVSKNDDPDQLGRVKVVFEGLYEEVESGWLPVMNLFGGDKMGAFFLPEVDDQVVVAYVGEDREQGVVVGSIWSENQQPPESGENNAGDLNKDGENNLKYLVTKSGHKLILDDKDGEQKINLILSGDKTRIDFLAKDKKINFETDMDVSVKNDGEMFLESDETTFKVQKDITFNGDAISMKTNSKDLEISASTNMSVEGVMIKLN